MSWQRVLPLAKCFVKPFVMLVLTDGEDTCSNVTPQQLREMLIKPGIPDFHLNLATVGVSKDAVAALREIAKGLKHVQITPLKDAGASAIQEIFRKQFVKTIEDVKQVQMQRTVVQRTVQAESRRV